MDNSNINKDENNSEITPEVNETNTPSDSSESLNNNKEAPQFGNGYNPMASSNKKAYTSHGERIARNKAALAQARARSKQPTKKNEAGEEQEKNFFDKARDKVDVLKAKKDLLGSRMEALKSIAHPIEASKMIAKKQIKAWLIGLLSSTPIPIIIFVVLIVCLISLGAFDDISNSNGDSSYLGVKETGFTISATSLSKEDYKKKLEDFSKENSNFQIFADNAYDIYNYCSSKNVNPELVAVRAYVEGAGRTTGTYNYWGMGCVNEGGLKACFNYDTFEEGYTDYVNNISQYNSLADMMSKYAYIGKYWYNPGDSGTGGCYYAPYIYSDETRPIRVSNACSSSAPTCSVGNKANCIETTDEDQTAYANWQVEKNMSGARKKIFGLEYNEGPTSYTPGDYKHLSTYTLDKKGLNVLNRTLTQAEINDLNHYINSEVDSAGYGTGAAVAAAGQTLTYWFEQKGYYLQYRWGGGHYNKADQMGTFIGVNPNWGSTNFGCDTNGRCYYGLDCSGFVSWAIRTACNPNYGTRLANFSSNGMDHTKVYIDIRDAKPGDLMLTKGHVRLVVKNNNDGSVIVAEAAGGNTSGLIFSKKRTNSEYKFIDMESYYKKNCKSSR